METILKLKRKMYENWKTWKLKKFFLNRNEFQSKLEKHSFMLYHLLNNC